MADPTTFPEEHVGEPLVYRRVSGFAIAALIVACCYAAILLIACAAGLYKWTPVLLPPSVQAIAVIGVGLSLAGLVHIRRSEGTVAGSQLAFGSLLISVLFGLGYGAYYAATYFAIRQQAENYTLRWFHKLAEGKINHAFLDTQDPAVRQRINPEDEAALNARFPAAPSREMALKSPLDAFRENEIVRTVVQGGPQTRITPLGVKDWEYAGGGYKVKRTYRIDTKEGVFEAQVTAMGSESKTREYEGREWHIVAPETRLQDTQMSELGKQIATLREQSSQFLDDWGKKLVTGRLEEAYLDTREPAERARLRRAFAHRRGALPGLALGVAPVEPVPGATLLLGAAAPDADELARQLYLPGYDAQFHRYGILQSDKLQTDDPATKNELLNGVRKMFGRGRKGDPRLLGMRPGVNSIFRTWNVDQDRLRLPHDCKLAFGVAGAFRYSADATVTVESDPGALAAGRNPAWRVVRVELMRGEDRTRNPGPGPGGMLGQGAF